MQGNSCIQYSPSKVMWEKSQTKHAEDDMQNLKQNKARMGRKLHYNHLITYFKQISGAHGISVKETDSVM